jgi:hypothetical protein
VQVKLIVSAFARERHFDRLKPYTTVLYSEEVLAAGVRDAFNQARPGYRDGVLLVPIAPDRIFSPVVRITEQNKNALRVVFAARRAGEEPFASVVIDAPKTPSKFVDVVVYRKDVLDEDRHPNNWTDADWEIVSVNARIDEKEPISPMGLARNILRLPGGTAAPADATTCLQLAEAVVFWSQHAMATGEVF